MFIAIVVSIFIISFLWALWALMRLRKEEKDVHVGARKKLSTGRVIFHRSEH